MDLYYRKHGLNTFAFNELPQGLCAVKYPRRRSGMNRDSSIRHRQIIRLPGPWPRCFSRLRQRLIL